MELTYGALFEAIPDSLYNTWIPLKELRPESLHFRQFAVVVKPLTTGVSVKGGMGCIINDVSIRGTKHKVLYKQHWWKLQWICIASVDKDLSELDADLNNASSDPDEAISDALRRYQETLAQSRQLDESSLRAAAEHRGLIVEAFLGGFIVGKEEDFARYEASAGPSLFVRIKLCSGEGVISVLPGVIGPGSVLQTLPFSSIADARESLKLFQKFSVCNGNEIDKDQARLWLGFKDSISMEGLRQADATEALTFETTKRDGELVVRVHSSNCERVFKGTTGQRSQITKCTECRKTRRNNRRLWMPTSMPANQGPRLPGETYSKLVEARTLSKNAHRRESYLKECRKRIKVEGLGITKELADPLTENVKVFFEQVEEKQVNFPLGRGEELYALLTAQLDAVTRAAKGKLSGIRWHPRVIAFASLLHSVSPAAYTSVARIMVLPSKRTLGKKRAEARLENGVTRKNLDIFLKRFAEAAAQARNRTYSAKYEQPNFEGKDFVLLVDAKHSKQGIVYSRNTGEVIGLDTLDDFTGIQNIQGPINKMSDVDGKDRASDGTESDSEEEEADEQPSTKKRTRELYKDEADDADAAFGRDKTAKAALATEAYVWYVRSLNFKFHHPVGAWNISTLSDGRFSRMLREVCSWFQKFDLRLHAVVFDGASSHRKLVQELLLPDPHKTYIDLNGERLWVMFDYCHLLKRFRNALLNREFMSKKGQPMTIEILREMFLSKYSSQGIGTINQLTKEHFWPDNYSRMNVKRAAQVMSARLSSALKLYDTKGQYTELAKYLLLVNGFFDRCNKTKEPITGVENLGAIQDLLDFLDEWEKDALAAQVKLDEQKNRKRRKKEKSEGHAKQGGSHFADPSCEKETSTSAGRLEQTGNQKAILQEEARERRRLRSRDTHIEYVPHQLDYDFRITAASLIGFTRELVGAGKRFDRIVFRLFCQDLLENLFSEIRASNGSNHNPNYEQSWEPSPTLQRGEV